MQNQAWHACWLGAAALLLTACGGAGDSPAATTPPPSSACSRATLAQTLYQQAAAVSTDTDFSLLVERPDGARLSYARGSSSPVTVYESASTSKWVSATIILRLVDRGLLSLDDTPAKHLSDWPLPATHPLSAMTLRQLLSFTSGLTDEPLCQNLPNQEFASCVLSGVALNANNGNAPGRSFHYNSLHLQLAGLMAMRASNVSQWSSVFNQFRAETGLFATGRYDLPSLSNPRLAGGMHWTGQEYLDFLRALQQGQLLSAASQAQMFSNQRGNATVSYSPAVAGFGVDWPYGLGNWQECATAGCSATRYSSPGAYGAYPVWDKGQGYIAMLARQGDLGSFVKGKTLMDTLTPAINAWATCANP